MPNAGKMLKSATEQQPQLPVWITHMWQRRDCTETRFWGVSFQVTKRKSYGHTVSLEETEAGFRAEYLTWKGT